MWIAAVLIGFILPVIFVVWREMRRGKAQEAKLGIAAPKKKEPFSFNAFARAGAIMFFIIVPALYISDISYSFYSPESAALKVAFKHTGKRIAECSEADLIKKEGERYRKLLKDTRQVQMNISKLAGCPRERYPVVVEIELDGKNILKKAYAPTGFKSDMSSYIYEEFMIEPGMHKLSARLYDKGPSAPPGFSLEETVEVKPSEIKLIRVDDKLNKMLLE